MPRVKKQPEFVWVVYIDYSPDSSEQTWVKPWKYSATWLPNAKGGYPRPMQDLVNRFTNNPNATCVVNKYRLTPDQCEGQMELEI